MRNAFLESSTHVGARTNHNLIFVGDRHSSSNIATWGQPFTYDTNGCRSEYVTASEDWIAGVLHHVMARGDRREEIFRDDRDRLKFLGYLSEGVERYRVKAHCFVLMENHFHLAVTTTEAHLSKWMHQLKTAYTVYFNRRYQLVGYLFQGRFRSTVIEADKYLLEVSRYLHLNPVRGKVLGDGTPIERRDRLRQYRWSGYRGYAGLEKRQPFVDGEAIERVSETYSGQSWKSWRYRRWVEEALTDAIENPFEAIQWQQVS
jgi:putative transposase